MPSIQVALSEKEFKVIREYATQCGETVSDLVRKVLIREATLADLESLGSPEYNIKMRVPDKSKRFEELSLVESNYNKNRRILGMKELRF